MRFLYSFLLLSIPCTLLHGQTVGQLSAPGGTGMGAAQAIVNTIAGDMTDQLTRLTNATGINDFAGSPYVYDSFKPVNVYYEDELMDRLFYRYNALNEEIEIKKTNLTDETPQRLMADKAIHLDIEGRKLSFKTFIDRKNNTLNGYLTLLAEGDKYDLYRRTRVKFTEGQKAQNSFVAAVPNRFTHYIEYYAQKKGVDRIDELKVSNSGLLKILPNDLKLPLKNYLKEENLNVKEEAHLIKVFEHLNAMN
jgi:hypothetical protein